MLLFLGACAAYDAASEGLWKATEPSKVGEGDENRLKPANFRLWRLNEAQLQTQLQEAGWSMEQGKSLFIPNPSGDYTVFILWKNRTVDSALVAKYPNLQTYQGVAQGNSQVKLRLENASAGLQAMVTAPEGTWYLAPYNQNKHVYMAFKKQDLPQGTRYLEMPNP